MARRKWLPDNVTSFRDKCGRTRYRFRKKGHKQHLFRSEPGTPEFMAEYAQAKAGGNSGPLFALGSFHALIESYYRSVRFTRMKPSTKVMRQNAIERWRAKHGDKPVKDLEARHIARWMAEMVETPHAANDLRKMLNQLLKHAILLGLRRDNPIDAVEAIRVESDGFHCWTEDEITQFEAHWPLGTRERLAQAMLLYTGLRRGDMVKLGRQHRKGDRLHLRHEKNRSDTSIKILQPLADALDAMPDSTMTYLVTMKGKPFEAASFGNWFREACNAAGLPHCSAHGLRKAMSRRLAETGATQMQGRAVTGHKTDAMFTHYAASANREKLSDSALDRMAEVIGLQPPMANQNGKQAKRRGKTGR